MEEPGPIVGTLPVPTSVAALEKERFGGPNPEEASSAAELPPTAAELSPAGAGEATAAGQVPPGPSNGLDAIIADHHVIRQLFYRCDNAGTAQAKLAAARDLVRHISRHASAEERTLYPLLRDKLPQPGLARMLYDRMVLDDQVNKEMLSYLESHVPMSEAEWEVFDVTLAKFRAVEEEHLTLEEAEVIHPLRRLLSEADAAKLGRKWAAAFANAPTHPHPGGPSAAMGAKLLHPVVGLLDRVWDSLAPAERRGA